MYLIRLACTKCQNVQLPSKFLWRRLPFPNIAYKLFPRWTCKMYFMNVTGLSEAVRLGLTSDHLSLAACRPPLAGLERRVPWTPHLHHADPQHSVQAHVGSQLTCQWWWWWRLLHIQGVDHWTAATERRLSDQLLHCWSLNFKGLTWNEFRAAAEGVTASLVCYLWTKQPPPSAWQSAGSDCSRQTFSDLYIL